MKQLDDIIEKMTQLRVKLKQEGKDALEQEAYEIDADLCKLHDLLNNSVSHNVSARFTVFSEIDGVFEQLSVCIYETKAEAECFADAMRDTVKYYDTEIVVLNVC